MLTVEAHAKINLFLDIEARREDGFHDIVSYMQTVSLSDTVTLERTESEIHVFGNDGVPETKDLCYRAAKLFFEHFSIDGGVNITVKKRIPMQGGLGGGSADCAAVLHGLERLYSVECDKDEMLGLAQSLGSDVPFCYVGGSKKAYGRGEILEDAPTLNENCGIVIVGGLAGASTPAQFACLDRKYDDFKCARDCRGRLDALCSAIENEKLEAVCEKLYNIFEETDAQADKVALKKLKQNGAIGTLMTGSGSASFAIFETFESAERAAHLLQENGKICYACRPVADI